MNVACRSALCEGQRVNLAGNLRDKCLLCLSMPGIRIVRVHMCCCGGGGGGGGGGESGGGGGGDGGSGETRSLW